jgi:Holliday junction DNA helicase RuvB
MMTRKFGGGPVGLDTLSTAIGEERGTYRIAVFI